jgi:hypothetical protein
MPSATTPLWPKSDPKQHFDKKQVPHIWQKQWESDGFDSSCVPTCLAMLAKMNSNERKDDRGWVEEFDEEAEGKKVNTQNPVEWSEALRPHGMKLAYIPADVRPLGLYLDELVEYNDLFMLAFYTGRHEEMLEVEDVTQMNPPRKYQTGSSHVVLLHKNQIYDPAIDPAKRRSPMEAKAWLRYKLEHYKRRGAVLHTKRLFRVLPLTGEERGL